MKLGFITDEVTQSISEAAAFAVKFGLDGMELRSVNDRGPFVWTDEDVEEICSVAAKNNLAIAAISAPLFKCGIHDEEEIARHIEGFRRCAEYCKRFGCNIIRGFDFWKEGASIEERAAKFSPIVEICEEYDVYCALENEPSTHGATPAKVLELVRAIGSPRVKLLFDPGNTFFASADSVPYPDDYELVRNEMIHVHIKDSVVENGEAHAVCIGTGSVNYPPLLKRLFRDDYDGWMCLETHYRHASTLDESQLSLPGGSAFSDGAASASTESMSALQALIRTCQEGKE